MRTSKPISTISYNSPEFLELKLTELTKAGVLSEWYFVYHLKEEDEKKDHIHVHCVPSKMLQTDDLIKEFQEFDPNNPLKPLTCPAWQSSKWDDWYLYGLHDPRYLEVKNRKVKYHYRPTDFVVFNQDVFHERIIETKYTSITLIDRILDAQTAGMSFAQFLMTGAVAINQVHNTQLVWNNLAEARTERNGRVTHTPIVDEETGEIYTPSSDS